MKNKILLVEDSPVVLKVLRYLVSQNDLFIPVLAKCYAEALECLKEHSDDFFAAVVDLNLPDAENGEIVDLVLDRQIPCIVLTGNFDDDLRLRLLNKGVVDYITKDSRYSFNHVMKVLDRLEKNKRIKVLVAEDSSTSRLFIKILLQQYQFQVVEAEDGQEALAILEQDSAIRMLITDYNMPLINGYDLVRMLRHNERFKDLVIIGLSAEGDSSLSAKFIKSGANDFLKKPFYHEEFHCRVNHNIEAQEMLQTIRDLANIDPLTKLYNRRFLFTEGESLYQKSISSDRTLAVVMLDIDFFKRVNDTHGHLIGDALLTDFSMHLKKSFPEEMISRFGGEEFCILISVESMSLIVERLERFLSDIKEMTFTESEICITCSGGLCCEMQSTLSQAIEVADERLYIAKNTGRDRFVYE
ncbi:response regulator [Marinomonas sp. 15G1-11]|uniref:diguanylate cyclase n=1 Tax=Marinomonas phaeophyticola TaxID=3004091 RepID=A0ABT4JZ25_9GAMM|nr:response regulator [Marinomonas sp. 15G1-11]MCZ2723018.1 response regulator [Marinomonas sp. 15G1-11]